MGDALYTKDMTRLILYFGTGESFTVPASVTEIAPYAFRGRSSLKAVTFEAGSAISSIGSYAFADCTSLSAFSLPKTITRLSEGMLSGCTALTSFAFPADTACTAIGIDAFRGCTALAELRVPAGIVEIGTGAFSECGGLAAVHLAVTSGWHVSDRVGNLEIPASRLATPAFAAAALRDTYSARAWTRVN